jgi:phosphoglycerol transferase MdoB-like AlkP superfamily enzyme
VDKVFIFLAMIIASLLLDTTVRPRIARLRSVRGTIVHIAIVTVAFGAGLAIFGNPLIAAALAIIATGVLTIASNAKYRMLGEPLVFSDLALLGAMVRHPQFYFSAIPRHQRLLLATGTAIVAVLLAASFTARSLLHLIGFGLFLTAGCALLLMRRWVDDVANVPALDADVASHGLLATLLLYWWRWRQTTDPAPVLPVRSAASPDIVVIVQCESFADPLDLAVGQAALPALGAARAAAWQWGDLQVSGFGAYTMRTEYGVLFGRDEAELGFRRYDPFLTALGEPSYALPARLPGYRSSFVHPHDLRFYARHRLMPASGFDTLIGEEAFAAPTGGGRYVDDRTLGAALGELVEAATQPTLLYAVTMENHGPWDGAAAQDGPGRFAAYLRHLRNSDAMLGDLIERLSCDGRSALLVFFGDHRPSIPGVTAPGGTRHTPYVMLRFGNDAETAPSAGRVDLSPAGLHHAILRCIDPGCEG